MAQHNEHGKEAEEKASFYLESHDYKILARNWRVSFAEIDIIAEKENCVYFVEVKYRKSHDYGGGFAAINRQKLHKLTLGAEAWVLQNKWKGEYCLAACQVTGQSYEVSFIEI